MYEFDHEIPTMETIADVLRYFKSRAAVSAQGGMDPAVAGVHHAAAEQRYPTRAELDPVAPDHPVIFATGPDASLNTMAFSRSQESQRTHRAARPAWQNRT